MPRARRRAQQAAVQAVAEAEGVYVPGKLPPVRVAVRVDGARVVLVGRLAYIGDPVRQHEQAAVDMHMC